MKFLCRFAHQQPRQGVAKTHRVGDMNEDTCVCVCVSVCVCACACVCVSKAMCARMSRFASGRYAPPSLFSFTQCPSVPRTSSSLCILPTNVIPLPLSFHPLFRLPCNRGLFSPSLLLLTRPPWPPTAMAAATRRHGQLEDSSAALAAARPRLLHEASRSAPLLGYDWVASMIEAETAGSDLLERDDAYFAELAAFRRVNRERCEAPRALLEDDPVFDRIQQAKAQAEAARGLDPDRHLRSSQPQPGFRVDERLFPQPVPVEQDPTLEVRGADLSHYVRISVPKARLRDEPRLQPRSREEGGGAAPGPALGLSQHCVRGYESARPSAPQRRPNVDLRSSLRSQKVDERWPYGMVPPPDAEEF